MVETVPYCGRSTDVRRGLLNFMGGDESTPEWTAYGPGARAAAANQGRLCPENVFHINLNIVPAQAE